MTTLQKQALFTLRQALVLCEQAEIRILSNEYFAAPYLISGGMNEWRDCLTVLEIEKLEKRLGDE